ncbi:hypothetical protein [Anaeroselena agilis]|uniref:Uncharacterized protein n=1 Tax=Anaeroselena agilis TaxID=3063788 RepID=A0ABU3P3W9_9FIRM|nr:hypothetical protein [Selenomonadales bacterium 4137-cl]
MGGRTFDQFNSLRRARAKDARSAGDPSPARQESGQEKLPERQPVTTKK